MNKSKIFISTLLAVLCLFVLTSADYAYAFSDVPETDPLAADIRVLEAGGFIAGYPDGSFRPGGDITRAEFVRMTNNIFLFTEHNISNPFNDVNEGAWHFNDVMLAAQAGYILGYPDGTFRPEGNITKEEVCAIYDRILSLETHITEAQMKAVLIADQVSSWANDSVLRVIAAGLMPWPEDGIFQASLKINRGQVAYASARALESTSDTENPISPSPGPITEYDRIIQRTIKSVKDIINDNVNVDYRLLNGNIAAQKHFLTEVCNQMQAYLSAKDKEAFIEDNIPLLSEEMKDIYSNLSVVDRVELKRVVPANVDIFDLYKLQDFFGF